MNYLIYDGSRCYKGEESIWGNIARSPALVWVVKEVFFYKMTFELAEID